MAFRFEENDLVYLSRYFNKNFVSLTPIRKKQNSKFIRHVRRKAFDRMNGPPKLPDPRMFYVGSVDFMVTEHDGEKRFAILETNGGSSRGILSIALDQIEMVFNAYKTAIDQIPDDHNKRIIIGTLPNDDLFQEKILLIEFLRQRYDIEGYSVGVNNSFNYDPSNPEKDDITLILSNYNNLLEHLSYQNHHIAFKENEIDLVIGDGIARRFPILGAYIKHDWRRVKTTIINTIYQVTDDKANTYLAAKLGNNILKEFRVDPLLFGKVNDPFHLEEYLGQVLTRLKKNVVIKPFGGSGGAGIQPILKNTNLQQITKIMSNSISDFYKKFDTRRNPFPYTIQEMAKFALIDHEGAKRTYDIRIYVVQKDGEIYPVGGNGRIAKAPFTGNYTKDEFVVNICGEWGVDIDRVLPLSPEGLKTMGLNEDDLTDLFCASCQIFKIITEKYNEIMAFKDWDKTLDTD